MPRAMWHLSSPTRDRTFIPCIGRWILNHWATREVPVITDFLMWLLLWTVQLMGARHLFLLHTSPVCWAQCLQGCRDDEGTVIAQGFGGACYLQGLWGRGLIVYPLWRLHCPLTVCSFAEEVTVAQGRETVPKETV